MVCAADRELGPVPGCRSCRQPLITSDFVLWLNGAQPSPDVSSALVEASFIRYTVTEQAAPSWQVNPINLKKRF